MGAPADPSDPWNSPTRALFKSTPAIVPGSGGRQEAVNDFLIDTWFWRDEDRTAAHREEVNDRHDLRSCIVTESRKLAHRFREKTHWTIFSRRSISSSNEPARGRRRRQLALSPFFGSS